MEIDGSDTVYFVDHTNIKKILVSLRESERKRERDNYTSSRRHKKYGLPFLPPPLSMFLRGQARLYLVPPLKSVKKSSKREREGERETDRQTGRGIYAKIKLDRTEHYLMMKCLILYQMIEMYKN